MYIYISVARGTMQRIIYLSIRAWNLNIFRYEYRVEKRRCVTVGLSNELEPTVDSLTQCFLKSSVNVIDSRYSMQNE